MLFRGLGRKPKPIAQQQRAKLPQVHDVVDVAVSGGGPRGRVSVEALHERSFAVQALPGMRPGGSAVFAYQNPTGKFSFSAICEKVDELQAFFALPRRIETLALFEGTQRRSALRLDAMLPAQWRFAPGGKGRGNFTRGSITDISRSGASLIVDRELKRGFLVEIIVAVGASAPPLTLLAEVVRAARIEASGKASLGVRFRGLTADEDRAIMEFINKRQAERRNRGLI
jgi:hypothetical protein